MNVYTLVGYGMVAVFLALLIAAAVKVAKDWFTSTEAGFVGPAARLLAELPQRQIRALPRRGHE